MEGGSAMEGGSVMEGGSATGEGGSVPGEGGSVTTIIDPLFFFFFEATTVHNNDNYCYSHYHYHMHCILPSSEIRVVDVLFFFLLDFPFLQVLASLEGVLDSNTGKRKASFKMFI